MNCGGIEAQAVNDCHCEEPNGRRSNPASSENLDCFVAALLAMTCLNSCGAAISARVMRRFEHSIRMQNHGASVAHRIGIIVGQYLDVMTGRQQLVDQIAVEAAL